VDRESQYGLSKKERKKIPRFFLGEPKVFLGGLDASPRDSKFFIKDTKRKILTVNYNFWL
jgi:hypothetical protein